MPPSGFNGKHSAGISGFLRHCVEDLISENRGIRTPDQALQRELKHIRTDLAGVKRGQIPTKVLELTQSFYEELVKTNSKNFDEVQQHSEKLLTSIENQIEDIKVADVI